MIHAFNSRTHIIHAFHSHSSLHHHPHTLSLCKEPSTVLQYLVYSSRVCVVWAMLLSALSHTALTSIVDASAFTPARPSPFVIA